MKLFAGSLLGVSSEIGPCITAQALLSESYQEAVCALEKSARELFPKERGFHSWCVSATEVYINNAFEMNGLEYIVRIEERKFKW